MAAERKLLSCAAAAVLAGTSEASIRRWIRAGDLPDGIALTLNGRLYIRRAALQRWLDGEQAAEPTPEPLRTIDGGR